MEFTSNNLTFVIVTFNSRKVIFDCLNSLPKDFHKLIIENSSDEKLKKELEQNYVNTKVILSTNIGMGAANNLGIAKSNTQYVYVLNPDVLLNKDTFSNINRSITHLESFAILSPISDNPNYPNYRINNGNELIDDNIIKNVEEIDGYSMIINKNFFSDNIFFDEKFFMYLENVDLCLRARKNNGKLLIIKNSDIHHLGAQAVDDKYSEEIELSRNWHWMWSKFYFQKKYHGYFFSLIQAIPKLFSNVFKIILHSLMFNKKKSLVYFYRLRGIISAVLGQSSWYRPRVKT